MSVANFVELKKRKENAKLRKTLDEMFPSRADAPTEVLTNQLRSSVASIRSVESVLKFKTTRSFQASYLEEMSAELFNTKQEEDEALDADTNSTSIVKLPVRSDKKKTLQQRRKEKERRQQVKYLSYSGAQSCFTEVFV